VGWGDVASDKRLLTVVVNQAGAYRVTLFASRDDQDAKVEYAQWGVEYQESTEEVNADPAESPE